MREIRPYGSMSGEWKRSVSHRATPRLYIIISREALQADEVDDDFRGSLAVFVLDQQPEVEGFDGGPHVAGPTTWGSG
jgi:hypothetical protein